MAEVAKQGDAVKVHYTGKLTDGTVFDSSVDREPLEFTLGEGRLIPGFERAVDGMSPGEKKVVTFGPDEAYGPRQPQLVGKVERSQIPSHIDLQEGIQLAIPQPDAPDLVFTVIDLNDSEVTVDANHPLAGQDLTFEIELLEVG